MMRVILGLPSGKHTQNYAKYRFEWVNQLFLWPFSIARLVIWNMLYFSIYWE